MIDAAADSQRIALYPGPGRTLALMLLGATFSFVYSLFVCLFTLLSDARDSFDSLRFMLLMGWVPVLGISAILVLVGAVLSTPRMACVAAGALVGALLLIFGGTGLGTGWAVDRWRIGRMTERAKPLIAAIRQYQSDTGAPPADLAALVPKYLPGGVPDSGLGSERAFHYSPSDPTARDWLLSVESPWPRMFPDTLYYSPSGTYYYAPWRFFGEWAYLPE